MLSCGRSSEWNRLNLFRERLSFLSFGIVDKAKNSLLGVTSTESELKLFELRFSSSKALKPERSLGNVQKSFDAISKIFRFGI
jgi:hypothetical protein